MELDAKRMNDSWQALCGLRYWLAPVDDEPLLGVVPEVWARLALARDGGAPTLAEAVKRAAPQGDAEPDVTVELGKLFADVHTRLCEVMKPLTALEFAFDATLASPHPSAPWLERKKRDGEKGLKWGVSGTQGLIQTWLTVFLRDGWLMEVFTKSDSNAQTGPHLTAFVTDSGLTLSCSPHQGLADDPAILSGPWNHSVLDTTHDNAFATFAKAVADLFEKFESLTDRKQHEATVIRSPTTDAAIAELHRHLSERLCVVLQGPPGTGKTYSALELVRRMANGEFQVPHVDASERDETQSASRAMVEACQWSALRQTAPGVTESQPAVGKVVWELVQMHPGYAYEDFVRGLETDPSKQGVHFTPVNRIVLELAEVALQNRDTTVVLIMDEINRCNLSSVLGELILALEKDKRGRPIRLQYGGSATIPANLWFIGTMNTADRSIAHIDYAIRRRFRFIDIPPDPATLESFYGAEREAQGARAVEVMKALNGQIKPTNLHVGPAYFMERRGADWTQRMADRLLYEVLPLLREYVAEDRKVLKEAGLEIKLREQTFSLEAKANDQTKALAAALAVFALP